VTRLRDDMEKRVYHSLHHCVQQVELEPEKALYLDSMVRELSWQEQKNRLSYVVRGTIVALAACIGLLFIACPVAGGAFPPTQIAVPNHALQYACFSQYSPVSCLLSDEPLLRTPGILIGKEACDERMV
jgi:hypothetical protein